MYIQDFVYHSPTKGHYCFYLLVITSNIAVTIDVNPCFQFLGLYIQK